MAEEVGNATTPSAPTDQPPVGVELSQKPEEVKEAPLEPEVLPGVAYIKHEYIIPHTTLSCTSNGDETTDQSDQPPPSKKRRRGQNKHRPRAARISFSEMLCPSLHNLRTADLSLVSCPYKERCRYTHDIAKFMAARSPDIGKECYVFEKYGKCPYGAACRFGSCHLTSNFVNVVREEVYNPLRPAETTNLISRNLQESLRKRKLAFVRSEHYLEKLGAARDSEGTKTSSSVSLGGGPQVDCCIKKEANTGPKSSPVNHTKELPGSPSAASIGQPPSGTETEVSCLVEKESGTGEVLPPSSELDCVMKEESSVGQVSVLPPSGAVTDIGEIKLRPSEKKKIDFRDKLYLAPLTTTGNLPFRRICKEFGADVTCGEMAMCTNLLQGQQSEWALLKRHQSEDLFGVQICGSHADTMTKCAELINDHVSVDFVDINTGCPIDLVFKKGAGSALMGRHTRFEGIVRGMVEVMDCPVTVKMRTGIFKKNWNAHKLAPKLRDWGVSMATVHGRSREQRYTKLADWDYIRSCVQAADPMPLFGNGDVLSYEDYNSFREISGVAGCMLARGALIKPWVFQEIKEQRHWDISSSERLDILQRYVNYGLEHWGSDTQGVENTRKFLLEWLSFLYRYIPVGLLERVPQKINQRPPYYRGRDDLETLMASNNCQDWIKISEMLLGPAPNNFAFLPKHKANAYE